VQGDEPFIDAEPLAKVIEVLEMIWIKVDLASMREITNEEDINNPNNVKVVVDQNGFALYFSRHSVSREKNGRSVHATHRIYAFRKQALLDFIVYQCNLGSIRKLEQLRYLEFGKRIKMVETTHVESE
jgi:3-deoxy-manno-octulosonate cytidylyltransferase (CMP-KDO synthetase)